MFKSLLMLVVSNIKYSETQTTKNIAEPKKATYFFMLAEVFFNLNKLQFWNAFQCVILDKP